MNATATHSAPMAARTFRIPPRPVEARLVAAFFLLVGLVIAIFIMLVPGLRVPVRWVHVATSVGAAISVLWVQHAQATRLLVVDDRGIRIENESRSGFARLAGRTWSVGWDEISRASASSASGMVQIRRKGSVTPLTLVVRQWLPEGASAPPMMSLILRRPDATKSELWRVLEARGLFDPQRYGAGRGVSDFDLARHPATRWSLIACVVLLGYGIADVGMNPKREYLVTSLVTALFAAALAAMLLARVRRPYPVPVTVTAVVALFAAGSVTIATWAALSHFAS